MHPKSTPNAVCEHCGTAVHVIPSRLATFRYCSAACHYAVAHDPETIANRFWSKVDRSGGPDTCWEWQGWLTSGGYGGFEYGGRTGHHVPAHRFAYELTNGPIPNGLQACHHCDNRRCCNPAHIFLGTQKDNMQDMARKGRGKKTGVKGTAHPRAKLTDDAIRAIRDRYATGQWTQAQLATEYGVSQPMIGYIVRGERWTHVANHSNPPS